MMFKLAAVTMMAAALFLTGCYEEGARVESPDRPDLVDREYDHLVEIRGHEFLPDTLTVEKGETVLWVNLDAVRHTVTSVEDNVLDSPYLARGDTYSFVFEETGEYEYLCSPHPGMRGMVVVQEE